MTLTGTNFLAIVVAAIAAWIFGAAYYGPLGKTWLAAQGRAMEPMKAAEAGKSGFEKAFPFVLCFIAELIMAWMMAGLMGHLGALTIRGGVISALFVWFGFVLTIIAVNNAFQGRKTILTVIDSGHWLGVLIIIGAIIGAFGA